MVDPLPETTPTEPAADDADDTETVNYHIVYDSPPPTTRALPDATTDAEAQSEAQRIAAEQAATLHLYRGPVLLGTATPAGIFTPTTRTA